MFGVKNLTKLVRDAGPLLDTIFGADSYEIQERNEQATVIATQWLHVELTYDQRDRFIVSALKPLLVHDDLREYILPDILFQFFFGYDIPKSIPRKQLDVEQVRSALQRIAPLVPLFEDEAKSRDAALFAAGYNLAYNDWASGKGSFG